jgi:hypothetical protein
MRNRGAQRDPSGYPGGGTSGPLGGPLGGIIFGSPRGGRRGGYPGGQTGSHTQSAGTEEIARQSGGDSMPVNDSYALQDTLARIRQRYALYFSLPPGVKAGEERQIELQLADGAERRNPGAEVHYRRAYYAPNSTPGTSTSSEPVTVSGNGPDSDEPDRPYLRRRPGISQDPAGSREGPLNADSAPAATPAPREDAPKQATPPAPASDPNAPGWRKARPDELQ